MKDNKSASLFQKEQVIDSIKQSFVKLNPRVMIKNPIMFTVEVCTAIMFLVMLYSIVNDSQDSFIYNLWVFVILFITLLFANFAEAIAEARGKAQADSLRKTREETPAKLIVNGTLKTVSSSRLKKGDIFVCEAGDVIPADGEIIEGLASIDESAITGESAPVIREAGKQGQKRSNGNDSSRIIGKRFKGDTHNDKDQCKCCQQDSQCNFIRCFLAGCAFHQCNHLIQETFTRLGAYHYFYLIGQYFCTSCY